MLVILLIGVARLEKGRTCKQQFKTVDLYWAEPVATGWFPVSTVARFTSIPNYLESVPPENVSALRALFRNEFIPKVIYSESFFVLKFGLVYFFGSLYVV